ncbi:MAG: plasmid replication protein, CyRepA1 family [Vibrio sp.]
MKNNYIDLTLQEVEEALSYIDASLPFNTWAKIGRAIYAEFGEQARDVFESWSSTGNSYHKREFNSWWKNFRKTKRTSFGSFIYEAMQAGWKPERKERSEEEQQRIYDEYQKRREIAVKQRLSEEEKQWQELEKEERLFNSWPESFSPTQYMLKKQMADVSQFADVRLGKDKYGKACMVWPIYDQLFNKGRFCGFERVLDKGFKIGKRVITKLSSDNARTDLGFYTFGKEWDCGPKRVFVVGGFADAYSAHKSSGEVIITPIGEGQIPDLIARLSEQHPDIQFIAAPDNDKAGRTMIERAGGFWSLPKTDGYDWSDVYINEGADALVEQLLKIRGFKTIESNSRYLDIDVIPGTNLLKSGMGTGKSTVIKKFIKKNPHLKTLVVSHRVALAQSLKSGLSTDNVSVEFYQDLILKGQQGVDENIALRNSHILVCSVDSLWRLAGSDWDVVFVDEVEQNLSQYFAKTIQYGEHCLSYLNFALTNSTYQILADAHLGNLTLDFCNYIGLQSGVIYDNKFKIAEGKKLFVYESKDHLMEEVMQQVMAKGKRYIYANSKEQVKTIATAIEQERERKHYSGAVLVVHADVTNTDEVKTALEDINAVVPDLDILIASPTLGTGFDIKSSAHQFDKTIGFLSSNVGTSEEGHQGLNRARDVKEFHVFLDGAERFEPTDPVFIQDRLIDQVSAETMKVLAIDPTTGEFTNKNPLYEWLFCKVKAKQNESRNQYKARFIELAKADGYEIKHVAKNRFTAKLGEIVKVEAKERNDRITLRDIERAPVHVGDMFQNVMRNGEKFSSTEITKSKVNYDLHLDAANDEQLDKLMLIAKSVYDDYSIDGPNAHINELDQALSIPENTRNAVITALTYKQIKNRFVDSIKKLSWVNVNEHSAKKFDLKDVQHAESRVSWRHISIRRSHMIKMLQVAGIDEQLHYNGKFWTKEQLSGDLAAWLRTKKTKDRLYKYSGITVSNNTLSNPVQWLNNHLASFGVPIVSGKKRIKGGKPVNAYWVDTEAWESIKTLVNLRTQGIEESLQESEPVNVEVLTSSIDNFIDQIESAIETNKFKSDWHILFGKLENECQRHGHNELHDKLVQAWSQISDRYESKMKLKADPPQAIVINKQTGQGGSPNIIQNNSNDGACDGFEGEEEGSPLEFPENATSTLSNEHVKFLSEVLAIAVHEFNLPQTKVLKLMLEYGLENIKDEAKAWAGSIKQAIMVGI